jgi:hypothetical protein
VNIAFYTPFKNTKYKRGKNNGVVWGDERKIENE